MSHLESKIKEQAILIAKLAMVQGEINEIMKLGDIKPVKKKEKGSEHMRKYLRL